jgi:hypothetical protein
MAKYDVIKNRMFSRKQYLNEEFVETVGIVQEEEF